MVGGAQVERYNYVKASPLDLTNAIAQRSELRQGGGRGRHQHEPPV